MWVIVAGELGRVKVERVCLAVCLMCYLQPYGAPLTGLKGGVAWPALQQVGFSAICREWIGETETKGRMPDTELLRGELMAF